MVAPAMILFPDNLRVLNIVRTSDGKYQASLNTDDHASSAYSVVIAETVEETVRDVCARCVRSLPPPPY